MVGQTWEKKLEIGHSYCNIDSAKLRFFEGMKLGALKMQEKFVIRSKFITKFDNIKIIQDSLKYSIYIFFFVYFYSIYVTNQGFFCSQNHGTISSCKSEENYEIN